MVRKILFAFLVLSLSLSANQKALRLIGDIDNTEGMDRIELYDKEIELQLTMESSTAVGISMEALEYARDNGFSDSEIHFHVRLGDSYQEIGEYVKAFESYREAEKLSIQRNYKSGHIEALLGLAKLNDKISAPSKSIVFLFEALDIAYTQNVPHDEASILFAIGNNYRNQRNFELSLVYLTSAKDKFKAVKEINSLAECEILIAKTYIDLGNFDQARLHTENALALANEADNDWLLSMANNDLAWINLQLKNYDEAIKYNLIARKIRKENNFYVFTSSLINIGEVYYEWGKYDKSRESFKQALKELEPNKSLGANKLKQRLLGLFIKLEHVTGNYKEAFLYQLDLNNIEDQINNLIDKKKISDLEVLFNIERYNSQKETERKLNEYKIEKQNYIIIFLVVLAFFLILSVVVMFNRYKLRKQLVADLESKNSNLAQVNDRLNKEIEDRINIESKMNAQRDHLHLINKILRHDLANDIATINSGISVYRKSKDENIFNELTQRIKKSIQLINNMKKFEDFMSIHADLKPIQLQRIFEEIQNNYKIVKFYCDNKLQAMADDSFISVVENIVRNALDHGNADMIEIKAEAIRDKIIIYIKNNGEQISGLIIDKIFQEGFKYGESANTGMGLYIVKKLMINYGGSVEVKNLAEGGVEFRLQLQASI